MFRSQHLLLNVQNAPVEQLRLLIFPLYLVEHRYIVQRMGNSRMFRPQHLLEDREGSLGERLRLLVLPLVTIEPRQSLETPSPTLLSGRYRPALVEGSAGIAATSRNPLEETRD